MQEQIGKVNKEIIDKNREKIEEADIILMQLEIPIETVEYVCKIAKNKKIILDPAPANNKITSKILEKVYVLKPNETELNILTGMPTDSLEEIIVAAKSLLQKGVKNVVVSLGGKGSILINNEKYQYFKALETKVVDTTAAGDSFIAAIALGISLNKNLEESINLANKVATLTVSKQGAQKSVPSMKEVIEFEKIEIK